MPTSPVPIRGRRSGSTSSSRRWPGRSTSARSTSAPRPRSTRSRPRSRSSPTNCRTSSTASRCGSARCVSTSTGQGSCSTRPAANRRQVDAPVTSTEGAGADLTDRFQAAGCGGARLQADGVAEAARRRKALNRRSHPRLQVTVKEPKGQANLSLGLGGDAESILLDQSHIKTVCTRVQFAAQAVPGGLGLRHGQGDHAAARQAARRAGLPALLEQQAARPGGRPERPDRDRPRRSDRQQEAVGSAPCSPAIPDAPISTFTLTMKGGKRGSW